MVKPKGYGGVLSTVGFGVNHLDPVSNDLTMEGQSQVVVGMRHGCQMARRGVPRLTSLNTRDARDKMYVCIMYIYFLEATL